MSHFYSDPGHVSSGMPQITLFVTSDESDLIVAWGQVFFVFLADPTLVVSSTFTHVCLSVRVCVIS